MAKSEGQILVYQSENIKDYEKSTVVLICCICRRKILEYEKVTQCPNCQTFFHSNHLSIWLNTKKTCPVCCYYFSRAHSNNSRRNIIKRNIRQGKTYRCIYCNHLWEAKSSGHQLWCPGCRITSCPHCRTAFGCEYLLRQLHMKGRCPKCNEYISIDTLKAKITVV